MVCSRRKRLSIIPERFCECSSYCPYFVCYDYFDDGTYSKTTDSKVFIDVDGKIRVYLSDDLLNSFPTDESYDHFVQNIIDLAVEAIVSHDSNLINDLD